MQQPQLSTAMGHYLAALRDEAGLNQADIAKKIRVSPARISRIEAGRTLTHEEALEYLTALETPRANAFRNYLQEDWTTLPKPDFNHPDRDLLWKASHALKAIQDLYQNPSLKYHFKQRVEAYEQALTSLAQYLYDLAHTIALIGSNGVGKSTTICRINNLYIGDTPVLEIGSGGTTLCEVHLATGPDYGILLEVRTEEEIRNDVTEFCEYLLGTTTTDDEDDTPGVGKEVIRVIRNMAGLSIARPKDRTGKRTTHDPAKELAESITTNDNPTKELLITILERMRLPARDRQELWYPNTSSISPLQWLKENFEQVNNGRHLNVSIPKKITVTIPQAILENPTYTLRIIDTKGVDQVAIRQDLERQIGDGRTIVVFCSRFNDAPDAATQQLLDRARKARIHNLTTKTCLLMLPRPEEAAGMKYDDGTKVEDDHEGYDIKGEQIALRLKPLGLDAIPRFFTARTDDPIELREQLVSRINDLRQVHRSKLEETIAAIHHVINNQADEQRQEILRQAARRLTIELQAHETITAFPARIETSLLDTIAIAHHNTIRATIRRQGDWWKLNYSHHLGTGARQLAASVIGPKVDALTAIANNLLRDEQFADAHDLIHQVRTVLENETDTFLRTTEQAGTTAYATDLTDAPLWQAMRNIAGRGYVQHQVEANDTWFAQQAQAQQFIRGLITNGWQTILTRVRNLLNTDATG